VLLVNAFEKLPGENFRDQRYTFLYEMLKPQAELVWFSSDFHHWSHTRRSAAMLPVEDRPNIRLIRTLSYKRNVSLRRVLSYLGLSVATLWNLLRLQRPPDIIVCMGAVEQMLLVVLYGRLHRVPVVIDVIDPWPDVYLKGFPPKLRWLGRVLLAPYFVMSRVTFALCTRGTAVSDTYLDWAIRRGRRTDRESFGCYYLGARNDQFDVGSVPEAGGSIACLFAGQFGFSYDMELILDAAEALQSAGRSDIRFVLCGAGDKQAEVTRRARSLPNVELHGWLSPAQLNLIGARCQVGLCTYRASATQSIPTKLFDYFSMGLYVVSSLAGEGEVMLRTHDVGRNYTAGDLESFIECLVRVREEVDLGPGRRAAIRATFDRHFSSDVIYRRMIDEVVFPAATGERGSGRAISA
jgi:glycosyltransferase involved in cell wall biosynthesis